MVELVGADSVQPSLIASAVGVDGAVLTFSLVVNDGLLDSVPDRTIVTVTNTNQPPTADAGADLTALEGALVRLDGSGSSDPDQQSLTYNWSIITGCEAVTLSDPSSVTPSFLAPMSDRSCTYVFRLVVSDGTLSATDTVGVEIVHVNIRPVADAGLDQTVVEGSHVQLNGFGSFDADGLLWTYRWVQISGPPVVLSDTGSGGPTFVAPGVSEDGARLSFQLTIDDGMATSTDVVDILVVNLNEPHCVDESATIEEDATLEISLTCSEGGHLEGLAPGHVRTSAGTGTGGWAGDGGVATAALLNLPNGVAVDGRGNLNIADSGNHRVRRVNLATGVITTIAGAGVAGFSGDGGWALEAKLNDPRYAITDSAGHVFIADIANSRIRRVDAETQIMTTVVGGGAGGAADGVAGTQATLVALGGIAFDEAGDLFLAETGRNRIRRVARGADGLVTGAPDEILVSVAGTGIQGYSGDGSPALTAQFSAPQDLAFDRDGNLFVADSLNHRIRRVSAGGDGVIGGAADEIVTTVAGGGDAAGDVVLATTIALNLPRGLTVDRFGDIYISEAAALRVRRVEAGTGIISTLLGGSALGEDILAATARTFNPRGLAADSGGTLFIAELGAHRIRAVRLTAPALTPEVVEAPVHGQVVLTEDGTMLYEPHQDFSGEDRLTFRVMNSAGQMSDYATLRVTITPVDDPPFANAGDDRTVGIGSVLQLDGSGSRDPDGSPITYSWALVSRPPGSGDSLQGADTANPTYSPSVAGVYVVELTVADALGQVATDSISITAVLLPDLVVSHLASTFDGQEYDIQVVAANRGAADTAIESHILLFLSSDETLGAGDHPLRALSSSSLCGLTVPPLPAGGMSVPMTISCRSDQPEARPFVLAGVDPFFRVQESDETNNVSAARAEGPDTDNDGILDAVDLQPTDYSSGFSDAPSGGITSGVILERGAQVLTVADAAGPAGVRVSAAATGDEAPATISVCQGAARFTLTPDDIIVVTCGSVTVEVLSGAVDSTYLASDGSAATSTLVQGTSVTFEPESATFTGAAGNTAAIVVHNNGVQLQIEPGQVVVLVKQVDIDVKPGAWPNSINLGAAGTVPAAILSTADFDAPATIDPESLDLIGAAVNLVGKAGRLQCGTEDVNADGLADLVCHFVTTDLDLQIGETVAVLLGRTFGGRQVRGQDTVRVIP
jgi:sugar lactone lactonase YvrE